MDKQKSYLPFSNNYGGNYSSSRRRKCLNLPTLIALLFITMALINALFMYGPKPHRVVDYALDKADDMTSWWKSSSPLEEIIDNDDQLFVDSNITTSKEEPEPILEDVSTTEGTSIESPTTEDADDILNDNPTFMKSKEPINEENEEVGTDADSILNADNPPIADPEMITPNSKSTEPLKEVEEIKPNTDWDPLAEANSGINEQESSSSKEDTLSSHEENSSDLLSLEEKEKEKEEEEEEEEKADADTDTDEKV